MCTNHFFLKAPWCEEQELEVLGEEEPAVEVAAKQDLWDRAFNGHADHDPLAQHRRACKRGAGTSAIPVMQEDTDDEADESDDDDAGDNETLAQGPCLPPGSRFTRIRGQAVEEKNPAAKGKRGARREWKPRHLKASEYRYGNKLCGLRDPQRPEFGDIAGYKWFCCVWDTEDELGHIICRSYLPFAKCDICVRQRNRDSTKRTQEERDADYKATADHLHDVSQEKACYYQHRDKARRNPLTYMSAIIDGADQSKYDLPYYCERSHTTDIQRLKMHVYGVLVHGHGCYAFTMPDHEAQGHNSTIQALWEVICDQYVKRGNSLPDVLYLQLDNTTRQNKGQFLMGFLSLLVENGVFERIYVCFLPVGHTHEDIDQMFSRFAIALRGRNMRSRQEMAEVMRGAYQDRDGYFPTVVHWDRIANISLWLTPFLRMPEGVMKYRHFRVMRSVEKNNVMLQVRLKMHLNMDEAWRGIAPNTNRTFLFISQLGCPDLFVDAQRAAIPDSWKRDTNQDVIAKMGNMIRNIQEHYPTTFTRAHVEDCEAIIALFQAEPQPFNWPLGPIKTLLWKGGGRAAPATSVAAQQFTVARQLGQHGATTSAIYMVRPNIHWTGTLLLSTCCVLCAKKKNVQKV